MLNLLCGYIIFFYENFKIILLKPDRVLNKLFKLLFFILFTFSVDDWLIKSIVHPLPPKINFVIAKSWQVDP